MNGIDAARILKRRQSLGIERIFDFPIRTQDQAAETNYLSTFNNPGINSTLPYRRIFDDYIQMYSSFLNLSYRPIDLTYLRNYQSPPSNELFIMKPKCIEEPKKYSFSVESLLK